MNRNSPLLCLLLSAFAGAALIGCDRDQEIRTYQAPKETVSGEQGILSSIKPTAGQSQSDALGDLQWSLPAAWTVVPVSNSASATFQADARISVDPADPQLLLSVSHLGDSGGARSVLMNVNRWEGQEGLPASGEADLPKVVQTIQVGDSSVSLVDLKGKDTRMLGVIFPHADRTWFFKLAGPAEKVAAHKGEFDQFVRSIHFSSPAPAAEQTVATPTPVVASPPGIQWQVPAGWTAEPTTPMLLARLQAGNGGALVKVSSFGVNNFGTLELNLNRWRGEVGLPPLSGADVKDVPETQFGGRSWKVYDFAGPAGADRKRSVIGQTQQGPNVYFFKISGPADAVEQQKAAFEQFISSVKFS